MTHHLGVLAERAAARGGTLVFEGHAYDSADGWRRTVRVAGGLQEAGVAPGDRVVVLMANCPEVSITYAALWWLGAVVTPVVFLVSAPELAHILTDSGAVAVVTTPEFAPKVAETGVPVPTYVVGLDSYAQLELAEPAQLAPRADDDLAALLYTGGTTGRSKGVMLSHAGLWLTGNASHQSGYVAGLSTSLTALPLSHAYGLIVTIVGMHNPEPGLLVLQRWFDPAAFLRLAAEHRIARIAVVPSMLQLLLAQP
ncbi:MAG TPA: AMP-binding protein, partial [Mycobacteriales bacterium]|nr:AMP-binding protein [Mycobacteriales bacterium]